MWYDSVIVNDESEGVWKWSWLILLHYPDCCLEVVRLAGLGQHPNRDAPYLSINQPLIFQVVNKKQKIPSNARKAWQRNRQTRRLIIEGTWKYIAVWQIIGVSAFLLSTYVPLPTIRLTTQLYHQVINYLKCSTIHSDWRSWHVY